MFPFIFLNNGKPVDKHSFQGKKNCLIWFNNEVSNDKHRKTEKLGKQRSGESFETLDKEALDLFASEIEEWALEVNKIAPIAFFIGLERITGSKWDKWSREKITEIEHELQNFSQSNVDPIEKMILEKTIRIWIIFSRP